MKTYRPAWYPSPMAKILVSGSLAYDRIMDFPGFFSSHFVPEKLHTLSVSFEVEKFSENFGGCAGNIAYNLALLGEEPVILSTAGKDFEKYDAYLKERKIDTESIHRDGKDLTSSAYIMTDKADNQITAFYPGAGRMSYGEKVPTEGAGFAIVAAGCVADIESLARLYRSRGIKYVLDTGQQTGTLTGLQILEALDGAAVLFANDYELGLIVFKTGLSEVQLLERIPVIVATLGAKGARIISKEGETVVQGVMVENIVDPTGAGDAHRAGFVKGMLAGFSWKECNQLASTVAAYAVESYGTQNHSFTMNELKKRYEESYGEKLSL